MAADARSALRRRDFRVGAALASLAGALPHAANAWVTCIARTCAGACPHGLAVGRMTEEGHRLLA